MTFDFQKFNSHLSEMLDAMALDSELKIQADRVLNMANCYDYCYQFSWMGFPIIQMPEDVLVTQEILFKTKPDVIIETGVAWGGSIVFSASVLERISNGFVIGVDANLPYHVRSKIEQSPVGSMIKLIEGNSIGQNTVDRVSSLIPNGAAVSLFLDSDHSYSHVIQELKMYSRFVTCGQYITVYATAIEKISTPNHRTKKLGKGNSPLSALSDFLQLSDRFVVDEEYSKKNLLSFAPCARIKCIG